MIISAREINQNDKDKQTGKKYRLNLINFAPEDVAPSMVEHNFNVVICLNLPTINF